MAKVDTDKFLELLKRSELLDEQQLAKALADVRSEHGGRTPADVEQLADTLVRREVLTRWQANNLLDGKHKGFLLGKYKLLRHLGTGGMSSVYLGEHLKMRHRVAIKVLPRSKVEDSSYLARFQLEARAAAALNHRNIVRAFDIDQDGKTHYLVMEYIEGTDLQVMVKEQGSLEYRQAADYVAQAAEGLQHAHDAGLIHRDIKPANLLLDGKGTVKILDMGLAKFSDSNQPSLTIAHDENVLGTADYLAPEQAINSHGVDTRADLYSLGCTLYFLLTGHPPFCEGTLPQRLMKHQTEQPPSIYEDRSDAPQTLINICLRMMVKSPEGRYQRADEVRRDLRAWLADPSTASVAAPSQQMAAMRSGQVSHESGSGSDVRKELRTRKAETPYQRNRRPATPGGSDTLSALDSDTFKARSAEEAEFPHIDIRTEESDKRVGSGSNSRGKGPGSDKPPAARRPDARATGERPLAADSGEVVFNSEAFGATTGSARSTPSIMNERAERRRNHVSTPIGIWLTMAVGVIVAIVLLVIVLNQ